MNSRRIAMNSYFITSISSSSWIVIAFLYPLIVC